MALTQLKCIATWQLSLRNEIKWTMRIAYYVIWARFQNVSEQQQTFVKINNETLIRQDCRWCGSYILTAIRIQLCPNCGTYELFTSCQCRLSSPRFLFEKKKKEKNLRSRTRPHLQREAICFLSFPDAFVSELLRSNGQDWRPTASPKHYRPSFTLSRMCLHILESKIASSPIGVVSKQRKADSNRLLTERNRRWNKKKTILDRSQIDVILAYSLLSAGHINLN